MLKKMLLIKNSSKEYFIRFYDKNKMKFVSLQLKTTNFYNELNTFGYNNRVMFIHNDDKEVFRKRREIWNKIIELIGINNHDANEFITADVYKSTSFFVEGNYECRYNKVVIVLHCVVNDYYKTSLVQHKN